MEIKSLNHRDTNVLTVDILLVLKKKMYVAMVNVFNYLKEKFIYFLSFTSQPNKFTKSAPLG